ncbi:MAG TPA: hypothetical protein VKM72_30125 [Thermoanaerobaculia bacterium]|nr:hypothetical protein [Thermoanaerobaculia bacterium]
MLVVDLLGAVLTLITLLFLGLSGYLLARLLLGEQAEEDPLAFAVAALLGMTALGTLLAIGLGAAGLLKIPFGLLLLAVVTVLLLRRVRSLSGAGGDPWGPARLLGRRVGSRLREHPALALIAVHAAAAEGLRGLLRPPLSWDSLMYHMPIVATWVQEGRIDPVFGMRPLNFYGYMPAGGSAWLWWWVAPSHSELYANLAFFPQAVLLALAVGAVARELGARRHWPLAAYLALMAPTVIRWAATQYVDILVGAAIAAAAFFALRWLRAPRWSDALFVGIGLGLASGAKVLGLAYALALAPMAVVLARREWRRRIPQVVAALLLCTLLGNYFYVRNIALGAGPLAAQCDQGDAMKEVKVAPAIPRINTVAYLWKDMLAKGWLLDSFLGLTYPGSLELGVGPQVLLLLLALLLPLGFAGERRGAILVWSQILVQLFVWVTVPYASSGHVFANIRYLIGALGLAFAGVVAWAERKGMRDAWIAGLALALLIQDLLMLHAEMPRGVRLALAAVDIAAVALALSPGLRGFARRRIRELAVAAVVLAVATAPALARFRVQDRGRAFLREFTTHKVATQHFARAWRWLDLYGGDGTVAVVSSPVNYFVYPAMGPHLERRATYVNINRQDSRNAADYPACEPRVDPDPQAWMQNLFKQDVRWIWLSRFPQIGFPDENAWAQSRPDLFVVRYEDTTNVIYEFLPWQSRRAGETR